MRILLLLLLSSCSSYSEFKHLGSRQLHYDCIDHFYSKGMSANDSRVSCGDVYQNPYYPSVYDTY